MSQIKPVIHFDITKNVLCVVEDYKIKNIRDAVIHYAQNSNLELTIIHSILKFHDVELIREYEQLSKKYENVYYHDIKASPDQFCLTENNPRLSLNFLDIFREPSQELYVVGTESFKEAMKGYSYSPS